MEHPVPVISRDGRELFQAVRGSAFSVGYPIIPRVCFPAGEGIPFILPVFLCCAHVQRSVFSLFFDRLQRGSDFSVFRNHSCATVPEFHGIHCLAVGEWNNIPRKRQIANGSFAINANARYTLSKRGRGQIQDILAKVSFLRIQTHHRAGRDMLLEDCQFVEMPGVFAVQCR